MLFFKNRLLVLCSIFTVTALTASFTMASVTLLDKEGWKFSTSGFVETDLIFDTTRSFTEIVGNSPVINTGLSGSQGRTVMSARNTRLAFSVLAPVQNDWAAKAYLEMDFFGYDPSVNSATANGPTNSESSFYTNPTLRMRQAYLMATANGLQILAGQGWTLFGWQAKYTMNSVSVPAYPGEIFQRTPQVTAIKSLHLSENLDMQAGGSIYRPTQRDADTPNLDLGVRFSSSALAAGYATYVGETSVEPISLAITATSRQFQSADPSSTPITGVNRTQAYAVAIDTLIPIIASTANDPSNTLVLTGEFTSGSGYADSLLGFTGNLAQLPSGTGGASSTNLDAGIGGFDSAGNFGLVHLQSWNLELQYQFAKELRTFVNFGYGQTSSGNVSNFTAASSKVIYDSTSIYTLSVFHDLTNQLRVAAGLDQYHTHYVDLSTGTDFRYQTSAYFRF